MSHLATYYNQKFSVTEFELLVGAIENNHNVKLAIKKLIQLRIMKNSATDRVQQSAFL